MLQHDIYVPDDVRLDNIIHTKNMYAYYNTYYLHVYILQYILYTCIAVCCCLIS